MEMIEFTASLPYRDKFLEAHRAVDSHRLGKIITGYHQKLNGLVFLHALTLARMAERVFNPRTDTELLEETDESLRTTYQVDAKACLNLMSRRPFSSMFKDIGTDKDYTQYFLKVLGVNSEFKASKVWEQLSRSNYAEQLFNPQTGCEKSLLYLKPLFKRGFFNANREVLTRLLRRGVLSTTMIRNLIPDHPGAQASQKRGTHIPRPFPVEKLFDNCSFFQEALKSVQSPNFAFRIAPRLAPIVAIPWKHDILSPPLFQNGDNSMGRMKEELPEKEKQFGEAIIEVRNIRYVQAWFLRRCNLDTKLTGYFLTRPYLELEQRIFADIISIGLSNENILIVIYDFLREKNNSFESQALSVFDFLRSLGSRSEDFDEIYYIGMPYGLRHAAVSE